MKGFVQAEKVGKILDAGWNSQQNVVLYGKGGYGKSAMTESFLTSKGIDYMVKSLSVGTTLDDLLGGINIKELQDTGKITYNLEESIFTTDVLVLEEGFDAPPRVLEGLKDILTSKKVRNGKQIFPIKTKMIIVCTNRSKESIGTDDSSKALMERFPLSLEVGWEKHTVKDYQLLLKTVKGKVLPELDLILEYVLESISKSDIDPPAPRTVIRMHDIVETSGVEALEFMDGIPNIEHAINGMKDNLEMHKKQAAALELYSETILLIDAVNSKTTLKDYKKVVDTAKKVKKFLKNTGLEKELNTLDEKLNNI